MDPQTRSWIEERINEIGRELGLFGPDEFTAGKFTSDHDLQEIEELYAERERLIQELERAA